MISKADPDLLKMVLVCGGNSCVVAQACLQALLSPADFAIYDTRRPDQGRAGRRTSATRMMTFMSRPPCYCCPGTTSGSSPPCVSRRAPASGDLTSQFLRQLARNADHYSPAEAARLSAAALEVLATRLAHEQDVRGWGTPEARR